MARQKPEVRVYPPGYGHTPLTADYRPWHGDTSFLTAWTRVRDYTMLDQARLYELWELTQQALKVPGAILEVGTWRGGSAALMGLRSRELRGDRPLIIADTFAGVAKAGSRDPYYRGGEHADTDLDTVSAFLHSLHLQNFRLLSGVFPDETAHHVSNETIALCHIDVDVYRSARGVFEWVLPRIPPGGIIVFDDYGFSGCEGVTSFVHELRAEDGICVIANVNGHGVVVKTHARERQYEP
ncbi:MAG: TylF/MycF/NovP-related O-methyltransferase [Alkalispirochaeta sp.]